MVKIGIHIWTYIARQINSAIADGYIEQYSFEDIYGAIKSSDLEGLLIINDVADFSILETLNFSEKKLLYTKLNKEVEYYSDNNERRKLGLSNKKHGLSLLTGIILEIIQSDYKKLS
jgi:hypothetical protein